ncbi:MAG: GxxExxY protein [Crinalium sp.]
MTPSNIPNQDITYRIIGCAMQVHRRMPRGLREIHYQRALTAEMIKSGLIVQEEYHLEVYDGEVWVGRLYLDHWVNDCIVVEDKAVTHGMGDDDIAQIVAYLAATKAKVGLYLNFGRQRLEYHRILPPKTMQDWQTHIKKYLWRPKEKSDDWEQPSSNTLPPTNNPPSDL